MLCIDLIKKKKTLKLWINCGLTNHEILEYEQGVSRFIDFTFAQCFVNCKIICPYSSCSFKKWQTRGVVYEYLICKQFPKR